MRLEHLDDVTPPALVVRERVAAMSRGVTLRRRQRSVWLGATAAVVAVALVAYVAVRDAGGEPNGLAAVPESSPSASAESDPSAEPTPSGEASALPVAPAPAEPPRLQALLGPRPVRPHPRIASCSAAEQTPMKDGGDRREGLALQGAFVGPGAVGPGESMVVEITAENTSATTTTFRETAAPRTSLFFVADLLGDARVEQPSGEHRLAPGEKWARTVRIPTVSCASTGGTRLPVGAYSLAVMLEIDGVLLRAFSTSAWVVDPAGGECFRRPHLQSQPPVDGLELRIDPFYRGESWEPWPVPHSNMLANVILTNTTAHAIELVEYDYPLAYLLHGDQVTGGWFEPGRVPEADRVPPGGLKTAIPAGEAVRRTVFVYFEGCQQIQPQTPGPRQVMVALLVERGGVRYHWAASSPETLTYLDHPHPAAYN